MAVVVRFPAMLHALAGTEIVIDDPVADLAALFAALHRRIPGLSAELDDPIYNFAVNGELLLHGVAAHPLKDGDEVEIVPTISGG